MLVRAVRLRAAVPCVIGLVVLVIVMLVLVTVLVLVDGELRRRHAGAQHAVRVHVRIAGSARLPSARFSSSSGSPASSSAPSAMSPEMPEKQSKYSTRLTAAPTP